MWSRLHLLERIEEGMGYLTDDDSDLLYEEGKFFDNGQFIYRDDIATTLSAGLIDTAKAWHASSYKKRWVAFGIHSWVHVSTGFADEAESVFLFREVNRILGWLDCCGGETGRKLPSEFAALGRRGAQKRHAPMATLREWAVEKYKAGEWKSANQAAHALKESVIEHGRGIGAHLSEENAQRTIAEWFRMSV